MVFEAPWTRKRSLSPGWYKIVSPITMWVMMTLYFVRTNSDRRRPWETDNIHEFLDRSIKKHRDIYMMCWNKNYLSCWLEIFKSTARDLICLVDMLLYFPPLSWPTFFTFLRWFQAEIIKWKRETSAPQTRYFCRMFCCLENKQMNVWV